METEVYPYCWDCGKDITDFDERLQYDMGSTYHFRKKKDVHLIVYFCSDDCYSHYLAVTEPAQYGEFDY